MNEANAELLDSDLLRDAEATKERPALSEEAVAHLSEGPAEGVAPVAGDELKTTRLPSVTPPPPPVASALTSLTTMMPPPMAPSFRPPMPSVPPPLPSHASGSHASHPPPHVAHDTAAHAPFVPAHDTNVHAPYVPTLETAAHAPYIPQDTASQGKPSWLRALLTSTMPPPETARAPSVRAPIAPGTAGIVFAALGLVFAVLALVTGLRGTPDASISPIVAAALVIARALVTLGAGALCFVLLRSAERLLVDTGAPDLREHR